VIRALSSTFPAVSRIAALSVQQGPVYALADAVLPWFERHVMSKLRFNIVLAAVLVVATAAPAAAQPATVPASVDAIDTELAALFVAGGLTADQAAARAAKASPAVWRKAAELDAAAADLDAAKLLRVPQVTATLGYTRLSDIDSPELSPGVTFPVLLDNYSAEAKIVIPVSDHLLRLPNLIEAARLGERSAKADHRATELTAATDARVAYYEWVRARLQLVISERQLTGVQATLAQVRALAGAQKVSRADLLRMESEEAEAEQTVAQLSTLTQLREEMLRVLIGAAAGEQLTVGEDLRTAFTAPGAASLDDLTTKATKQRLEFKRIELGLDANHERSLAERANLLPKLSAFAVADYSNPSDRALPPSDDFTGSWAAGAQLTWSLNDALTSSTTKHRLRAEANALRADREALVHAARIELLDAQEDVALAQQALTTSHKGLVAAEEGYRVRKAQLDAERATAVELVDAETELTRARIAALDARIDLRIAVTQLDHALGNDVH
jgi:outer membrane protein TolC